MDMDPPTQFDSDLCISDRAKFEIVDGPIEHDEEARGHVNGM